MKLGEYELLDLLGRGGMGAVYRARHPMHGDMVAVKVMTGVYDESDLRRFVREANAGVAVSHENVIRVLEAGTEGGRPFIVLELAPGGSLADRLDREKRLPWADVARLGIAVARGLGAVHAAGLIHRDLKPANVLLTRDGTPKLADFGLVKKLDGASSLTASSVVVGTPQFMSPEQLDGQPVAASSDLYSLGGLLFALLVGEPPFVGSGFAVFKRIMKETPRSVRSIVPEVPAELDALVARLLEKSPGARGTTGETEAVLEALLLRAQKPPEKSPAAGSRTSVGIVLAAGLACALIATTLVFRSPSSKVPPPETAPVVSRGVSAPGPFAYASLPLSSADTAPGSSSSLRITWAHGRTRFAHAATPRAVAYSPDGRLIASHDGESQAFVWDAATGDLVNVADGPAHVTAIAFEANSSRLLVGRRDGTISSIGPTGPARRFGHISQPASAIWCSAKEDAVYMATENGGVLRVAALGASSVETLGPILGGTMKSATLSPDGRWAAFISLGDQCVVRPSRGDGPFLIRERVAAAAFVPGVSPRCLLVSGGEARLYDLSAPDFSSRLLGGLPPGEPIRAATSTLDGKRVAVGGGSLAVFDVSSGDRSLLVEGGVGASALAFSPDGSRLASGEEDRLIRRWDVARATLVDAPDEQEGPGRLLAASGDGRRVAIARWNGAVVLLDTATGETRMALRATRPVAALAMAHNGTVGLACDDERVGRSFDATTGVPGAVLIPTSPGPTTRGPAIGGVDGEGKLAVVAGNAGEIAGYGLPAGERRFQLPVNSGVSFATSPLSRDGARAVLAVSDELVFLDTRSGERLGSVAEPGVLHCTIHPGGERVASARIAASVTEVLVRSFGTGAVLHGPIRVGMRFPVALAFLDESTLAYASSDIFALVDLRTGVVRREVVRFAGVSEQVASVAPLDDGTFLVLTRRGLVARCERTDKVRDR